MAQESSSSKSLNSTDVYWLPDRICPGRPFLGYERPSAPCKKTLGHSWLPGNTQKYRLTPLRDSIRSQSDDNCGGTNWCTGIQAMKKLPKRALANWRGLVLLAPSHTTWPTEDASGNTLKVGAIRRFAPFSANASSSLLTHLEQRALYYLLAVR
jgi:hypothetical protein